MRILRSAVVAIAILCLGGNAAPHPEPRVVVGCVEYINPRRVEELYSDVQTQFVVLKVAEEFNIGKEMPSRIMLGVDLRANSWQVESKASTKWSLDQKFWKKGTAVVGRVTMSDAFFVGRSCFPSVGGGLDDPSEFRNPAWPSQARWDDPRLERFQPMDVYCVSVDEVLLLSQRSAQELGCIVE